MFNEAQTVNAPRVQETDPIQTLSKATLSDYAFTSTIIYLLTNRLSGERQNHGLLQSSGLMYMTLEGLLYMLQNI